MIWLGYAGFSGAIVASLAILATIVGVSTETVLGLVAWSAGTLFGAGGLVHLVVYALKTGARGVAASAKSEPLVPAFLRPSESVQAATAPVAVPKGKVLAGPPKPRAGAADLLFPQRA